MTAYADTISRPVKTLTEAEQRALLKAVSYTHLSRCA